MQEPDAAVHGPIVIRPSSAAAFLLLFAGIAPAQKPAATPPTPPAPSASPVSPAAPAAPAPLDPLTLEPEIRSRIDAFFTTLKQRKVEDAYRRLLEGSVLAADNPALVAKLIESTNRVLTLTGRIDRAEILRVRPAGKSLREVTCLLSGEKRPLRWRFYFYLSDARWQVLDTNVATEAAGFFEDPN